MPSLILLRHGQSEWNHQNRFTGWTDVKLTEEGKQEAFDAGQLLKKGGFYPDLAHCSVLTRAIQTLEIVLEVLDRSWIPIKKTWRLNERHYGALQGLNKSETKEKYGQEQLKLWRRSYQTRPPELDFNDERHPRFDSRYKNIPIDALPTTESLQDVLLRLLPYYQDEIFPDLTNSSCVLIVAHGNSLRALIKYLEKITDDEITNFELATGKPRVYQFNSALEITDITQF